MAQSYIKPNLFILGAAKSGTTSLHDILSSHNEIFMSAIKEPTFFCDDFQVINNEPEYYQLFKEVNNEKYIGESSHAYLSNPTSASKLKFHFPNAKFILILRNPADRAYSLYMHMKRHHYERTSSFEKALAIERTRMNDHFRKNNPQYFYNFMYFNSGKYGEQIKRYLDIFDKNQFLFLTYDELKSNRKSLLLKITKFLNVSDFKSINPISSNVGFDIRSHFLERLAFSRYITNKWIEKTPLKKIILAFNHKPIKPINSEIKNRLMENYKEDLKLLEQLTGMKF